MIKRFIYNFAIFSCIILAILYVLQFVFDRECRRVQNEAFAEWNDCYNGKIAGDVLMLGSSRMGAHISPKIIDEQLHVNSYNLGINGGRFLLQNGRFKVYLAHTPKLPKNIIHGLDIGTLDRASILFVSNQFVPYLDDTIIRKYTEGYKGSYNKLHYYFPLYKYNNSFLNMGTAIMNMTGLKTQFSHRYKGYKALEGEWVPSTDKQLVAVADGGIQKTDSQTVKEFEAYLQFCKEKNINLIFVYTPEYIDLQKLTKNRAEIINLYKQYATTYNITFLDYSEDSISYQKSLFKDPGHLNRKGAELFSMKLAKDLKGKLNE